MYGEKRKYENVPTTELLDFVATEIPYGKDKERDKQTDFRNELEEREPFHDMMHKIKRMSKQITELNNAVEELMNHTHSKNDLVVIPIKDKLRTF